MFRLQNMHHVHNMDNIWFPDKVIESMKAEAESWYPLETGGVLMGYRPQDSEDVVVTTFIGPGVNAVHKRFRFEPDTEWQIGRIQAIYEATSRTHTYLGEWHTHPKGSTSLSILDRRTLGKIASARETRAPTPIMAIMAGQPDEWKIGAYCLTKGSKLCIFGKLAYLNLVTYTPGIVTS